MIFLHEYDQEKILASQHNLSPPRKMLDAVSREAILLKSFMGYRTLRLWMRGRGNGWGENGELNGYIKLGRDEHNFYMYRTPVNTGNSSSRPAATTTCATAREKWSLATVPVASGIVGSAG